MLCPQCQGIEDEFGRETARRQAEALAQNGPGATTGWLIEALLQSGVKGQTVLEVGGGVGAVTRSVLQAGARDVVFVEASTAYLDEARRRLAREFPSDRIRYIHGDYVDVGPSLPNVDIACLDRVICCYPDMPRLVGLSSQHADRLYAAVFPRGAWWVRLAVRLINLAMRVKRSRFRVFAHRPEAIDAVLGRSGFERLLTRRSAVWELAVYRRASENPVVAPPGTPV